MAGTSRDSENVKDYLTVVALEDGLTVILNGNDCEYCIDGSMEWIPLQNGVATPSIADGHTLSFRATITPSSAGVGNFVISKKCNLEGNCMSLLYGGSALAKTSVPEFAFSGLFMKNTTIVSVSSSFLPAKSVRRFSLTAVFVTD